MPDQPKWTDEDLKKFKAKEHSIISRGSAFAWMGHLNALKWYVIGMEEGNDVQLIILSGS